MESRLRFITQERTDDTIYSVINDKKQHLCNIEYRRTGTFLHWCQVIPIDLIEEMCEFEQDLIFSPGCQDEIRAFCKKLNGRKNDGQ